MNLYRNFGNLLETWVLTEGYPALELQQQPGSEVSIGEEVGEQEGAEVAVLGGQPHASRSGSRDSLRFCGATARSESEDSGVELLSASSIWTTQQHAVELKALEASGSGEGLDDQKAASAGADHHHLPTCPSSPALSSHSCPSSPSSTSSSSSFQSIGSSLSPGGTINSPSGLRVEQALWRADPTRRQVPRRGLSLMTRGAQNIQPRKRINSSTGTQASRGQSSANLELWEERTLLPQTVTLGAEGERPQAEPEIVPAEKLWSRPVQQNDVPSAPLVSRLQAQASGAGEPGWTELSPGFFYLEQMCRMLEKLAQLKMGHLGLQTETEQLRNQQNHRIEHSTQSSVSSQSSSLLTVESSSQIPENRINQEDEETLFKGQDILVELRRRSMSDAGRLTPHCYHRMRSRSIGDLLEEEEEETLTFRTDTTESQRQQPPPQQQSESAGQGSTGTRGLRQKIASLRRNEAKPDLSDGRSQTLPRLGKKASLKGLTQFFKKRSKSSSTTT